MNVEFAMAITLLVKIAVVSLMVMVHRVVVNAVLVVKVCLMVLAIVMEI